MALAGLTLGLVLAEGTARLYGDWLCADVPGVLVESDAALGWRQRPNLRGWAAFCRGQPIPPTSIATDAHGFLDAADPRDRSSGAARILLLGGNVPQAFGVPRSLSMAGMLEGRADRRRGRALEVVNGAMSSFALDQDLLLLRAEGARVAPDLVLAVVDPVVETTALTPALITLASSRAPAKPYFDAVDGKLVAAATPPPDAPPPGPAVADGPLAWSALHRLVRGLARTAGAPPSWLPVQPVPLDVAAERAHGERVLTAVLEAMRDEAARLGARFGLVLVPPPRDPRFGEETPTHRVLTIAHQLDIPATSLALAFRAMPEYMGRTGYVGETTRFNADGHFLATLEIWSFLERQHLLPDGVVPTATPAGGRVAPLSPFPDALARALWAERTSGIVRLVGAALVSIVLVWLAAPLPARGRDWATLAASVVAIWLLVGLRGAGFSLGVALAFAGVAEIPWRWPRRAALAVLATALVALPIDWLSRLPTERSVPLRPYLGLAAATSLWRGIAYVTERRRLRMRPALVDVLLGLLFFPTFVAGPIQSVWSLAHARARGTAAPATTGELARHLRRAAVGALVVAWGATKVLVAPLLLNLVTPDVLASSGDAVSRTRLWLWTFETSVYLWAIFSGLSDVGAGLAAMVGVRTPANFRRPWAARTPIDLWRRTLVTVSVRIRRLVCRPVSRRLGMPAGTLVTFLVASLWYAWTVLAVYGLFGSRPGAWVGLALWAILHTTGVLVADRRRPDGSGASARTLGAIATQLLTALAWVPFVAFPFGTLGTILRIYARLVGLR
jgi:D-alanyl-lipoteichoic acid acyltransferase DltB (MBOAT superfamily)